MASLSSSSVVPGFISNNRNLTHTLSRCNFTRHLTPLCNGGRKLGLPFKKKKKSSLIVSVKGDALQYRKIGDSDLVISEITLGTMTFGEQNTEKEAHELLSYSLESGINAIDTAEVYPVPIKKETQGRTDLYIGSWLKSQPRDKIILATKVAGYSERSSYLRDDAKVVRVDAANIRESVEKSLKRLNTDYIDLLQIHWPDRYVALFGEYLYDPSKWRSSVSFVEQLRGFQELIDQGKVRYIGVSNETSYGVMEFVHAAKNEGLPKIVPDRYVALFGEYLYDPSKWRSSVSFVEQLRGFQELIDQGKVRYIGVSNETSYGVMEFVHAAKNEGLPKIVSIQNNYSLLVRCKFEIDLVEVCHPNNCNIGLLAYSPLAGGSLTGKYLEIDTEAARKGRFNIFPGYMERYNKSDCKEVTKQYLEVAKKHGLTLVELALGFTRDRSFMTSTIIGATSLGQLKEDIDAFLSIERPLPPQVMADVENVFKRYKDPAID